MKLYGINNAPKTVQQTIQKRWPHIMPGWMLGAARSLVGKGDGNAVWFLSRLDCEQETGHLQMGTKTFEASHGWPRESLGCSDPPNNFFRTSFGLEIVLKILSWASVYLN